MQYQAIPRNTMLYHATPSNVNVIRNNAITYKTIQYHAIPCNTMQYLATPHKTMQNNAITCNTMQYHAISCNTMQYHASLISADGAYLRPVGSIMAFLQYIWEVLGRGSTNQNWKFVFECHVWLSRNSNSSTKIMVMHSDSLFLSCESTIAFSSFCSSSQAPSPSLPVSCSSTPPNHYAVSKFACERICVPLYLTNLSIRHLYFWFMVFVPFVK